MYMYESRTIMYKFSQFSALYYGTGSVERSVNSLSDLALSNAIDITNAFARTNCILYKRSVLLVCVISH